MEDIVKNKSTSSRDIDYSESQIKALLGISTKSKLKDFRVKISPKQAEVLLKCTNTNNRPMSIAKVSTYAKDMQLGNWSDDSTDAIAFDKSGVLVNGQHRLKAVVKSGKTVQMLVSFGITPYMGMDTGKTRTIANNVLMFDGADERFREKKYKVCLSVMQSVQRFHTGKYVPRSSLTPQEQVELANKYADALVLLADNDIFTPVTAMGVNGKSRPITSSAVYSAFFLAYMNGVSLETLKHIVEKLRDVTNATSYDKPILSLRDVLISTVGGGANPDCVRNFGTQYCINSVVNKSRSKSCKFDTSFYQLDFNK